MIRIVVVLPAPLAPMKPTAPPRGIVNERSRTAWTEPNSRLSASTLTSGAGGSGGGVEASGRDMVSGPPRG